MRTIRIELQPSFVLHTKAYRDTSLLVNLLTKQYGKITVVAKGTRNKRSTLRALLQPFTPLLISFSGKGDMYTLKQAEADGLNYNLQGKTLLSGFYLNELLIKLLPTHESYQNIYENYHNTIKNLSAANLENYLRIFEKNLLRDLGYGLELDKAINGDKIVNDEHYQYKFGFGFSKSSKSATTFSGQTLLALKNQNLITTEDLADAKRLLRSILAILLDHKPIKSKELFLDVNVKPIHHQS